MSIALIIFIIFISLLFLTVYLGRSNISNLRHFLHNSTFPSFNLSMFTEKAGTNINNEDRRES